MLCSTPSAWPCAAALQRCCNPSSSWAAALHPLLRQSCRRQSCRATACSRQSRRRQSYWRKREEPSHYERKLVVSMHCLFLFCSCSTALHYCRAAAHQGKERRGCNQRKQGTSPLGRWHRARSGEGSSLGAPATLRWRGRCSPVIFRLLLVSGYVYVSAAIFTTMVPVIQYSSLLSVHPYCVFLYFYRSYFEFFLRKKRNSAALFS